MKTEQIVKLVLDEIEARTGKLEEIGCESFDEIVRELDSKRKEEL